MLDQIIFPAAIRIVRAFPAGFNSRPNSFGVINTLGDIDSDSLNQSMRDGRIGRYWGRKWEASGKDSGQIQFENSLVFIRTEGITFSKEAKHASEKVCQRIEIAVASLPECEGCTFTRSDSEIEIDNAVVLNKIVSELTRIAPFVVTIPTNLGGIGASTYWIMPSEKAWLETNGVIFPTFKSCPAYLSVTKTSNEFASFTYGTAGMIITTAKLQVCFCDSADIDFDFRINDFKAAAYVGCETC
jgi:hypothetical protein